MYCSHKGKRKKCIKEKTKEGVELHSTLNHGNCENDTTTQTPALEHSISKYLNTPTIHPEYIF